jgi:hypothetical protein
MANKLIVFAMAGALIVFCDGWWADGILRWLAS